MSNIQQLSLEILQQLWELGEDKVLKAIRDAVTGNEHSKELIDALTLVENSIYTYRPQFNITEKRPTTLECDVVRFQNKKDKWVAFVGLLDGYPYEIFTGVLDDEDGISLPKNVVSGHIIKRLESDGSKRYDFTYANRQGYKTTIEGLSERFNKEYWNYAKLISGVLRYRMPIDHVIRLVGSLQLGSESINTWKNGVERALKKYVVDGTEAKGQKCPQCGQETLVYQEGCLICKNCGASLCG